MIKKTALILIYILVSKLQSAESVPQVVTDPWITTDKSVDCRTVDTIVRSLSRDGMNNEEKVLAAYNFIRRAMVHGGNVPIVEAYDFHRQIHVFGNGSCLRQTTPLSVILQRMGFKTRGWAAKALGHHLIQVYYDEKWHVLDPHMTFYVYDRNTPRSIASIEQIKQDPTLVSDAVKENRACPGFLLCGDNPELFTSSRGYADLGDFPESKDTTPRINEPFGALTLRRGESYIRTFTPGETWILKYWPKNSKINVPVHGCGRRDANDKINLPLWEPYVWKVGGSTYYRHGAAGRLIYVPNLSTDHYRDATVLSPTLINGTLDGKNGLVPNEGGKGGDVTFAVRSPYAITSMNLSAIRIGTGAFIVSISIDQGKTWRVLDAKVTDENIVCDAIEPINGSFDGYWVKIALGEDTGLSKLELTTTFQINPASLPFLVPGDNVVNITAEKFGAPLTWACKWSEGEKWEEAKEVNGTITANTSVHVKVNGSKYPRIGEWRLSLAP